MFKSKNKDKNDASSILLNSAKYVKDRVDPLDCLSGLEIKKKETKKDKILNKIRGFGDFYLQKKEFKRVKNLSAVEKKEEAFREYAKYYKNLYVSKSANHEELKILISKYDVPNQKNPYDKNLLEYSLYHDCGFLGAEIQAILIYSKEKRNIRIEKEKETEEDLYKIINEEFYLNKIKNNAENAMISFSYILFYGVDVHSIYNTDINKDNIELSIIETLLSVDYSKTPFTKEEFTENLLKKELINNEILKLLKFTK